MAPPKNKEKTKMIGIRVPASRFKEIRKFAKSVKKTTHTEMCRDIVYAFMDEQVKQAA